MGIGLFLLWLSVLTSSCRSQSSLRVLRVYPKGLLTTSYMCIRIIKYNYSAMFWWEYWMWACEIKISYKIPWEAASILTFEIVGLVTYFAGLLMHIFFNSYSSAYLNINLSCFPDLHIIFLLFLSTRILQYFVAPTDGLALSLVAIAHLFYLI